MVISGREAFEAGHFELRTSQTEAGTRARRQGSAIPTAQTLSASAPLVAEGHGGAAERDLHERTPARAGRESTAFPRQHQTSTATAPTTTATQR